MERKEINDNVNELVVFVKQYIKIYLDLFTLKFVDKLSLLLSKLFYLTIISFFIALTVVFSLISLGLFLGELFDSYSLGFLSMAGLSILMTLYYVFKPVRGRGIYKLLIWFFALIADNDESKKS
tara:strand:+ start:957 stop:1328 length:372 start_codon:yes stop_codon:yes gene_type:complete